MEVKSQLFDPHNILKFGKFSIMVRPSLFYAKNSQDLCWELSLAFCSTLGLGTLYELTIIIRGGLEGFKVLR